jgi:hypothetical protein
MKKQDIRRNNFFPRFFLRLGGVIPYRDVMNRTHHFLE